MFQFIHAADIHLDSPMKGLNRFESAPVERIQSATRDAFSRLIQLALDECVAFVLIAGDLWDCEWTDAAPGLFFISQVKRLDKAGIPVFIIKGNHDAQSQITTGIRNWPSNVTMFAHRKPETVQVKGLDRVFIHGQSYAHQHVQEDLSAAYPAPVKGAFNIGMLHTCLEDGADYAPVCLDKLVKQGYNYWALGHIHDRQDLSRDGVHIEFPGNPQGRHMRETGPKGCTVVAVGEEHSVTTRFEALDVVRWQELSVQAEDANLESKVRQALAGALADADGRLLAVRLNIEGNVIHGQVLRDRMDAIAVDTGEVWIEKIVVKPPNRDDQVRCAAPLSAELKEIVAELQTSDDLTATWMHDFLKLNEQLADFPDHEAAIALHKREQFLDMVSHVAEAL